MHVSNITSIRSFYQTGKLILIPTIPDYLIINFVYNHLHQTVAMAQVLQRMRFNWLGGPAPEAATKHTFKVVLALILCYTVFTVALELAIPLS